MTTRKHLTRSLVALSTFSLLFGCSGPTSHKEQQTHPDKPQPVAVESEASLIMDAAAPQPPVTGKAMKMKQLATMAAPEGVGGAVYEMPSYQPQEFNTESYDQIEENRFINVLNDPLSTFSIDVDTASYANVRRFINSGSLPPVGAVRIEEMINYFDYDYPAPESGPFSLAAEVGPAPWHSDHKLVKIGLQAKDMDPEKLPPSNLVFLIDVSGSMNQPNKLPLLKQSMLMMVDELTARDRVSIVVYAGSDRVVLTPTAGDRKEQIREAVNALTSGGSTHGSSGIRTAYNLAAQTMMPQGNNRVILASDGDFNVGVTSRGELKKLIEEKRQSGIYLTVLGFGMGNYHDDTMEVLADSGNGNYAYIDSLLEAKKVLVKERAATLFALARDVKIQVEFNPALVGAYRLIGYENRLLADEDFRDDSKDAGEIGLGHSVTALYEIIPAGSPDIPAVDNLKYQRPQPVSGDANELMTLKLRYKASGEETSTLLSRAVADTSINLSGTSDDFRFSAAVAGFGMALKDSPYLGDMGLSELISLARSGRGSDLEGYRAECIRLMELAQLLDK